MSYKKRGLLSHLRNVPKSLSPKNIGEYIDKHTVKMDNDLSVKQPIIIDSIKKYIGYSVKAAYPKSQNLDHTLNDYPTLYLILLVLSILGVIGFSLYEGNVFEGFDKKQQGKKYELTKKRVIILLCLLGSMCVLSLYNIG